MENGILIVCYSYSGNTYRVASEIKRQIGGTLCEIYPKQPYSMGYETILEQVRKEIETGFHPHLFPTPVCLEKYPVIFAGSLNWCGTVAPPLASWLSGRDLSGKIVLPFWSHCGGGWGNLDQDIRKLCPKSEVRGAFHTLNDGGSELPKKISAWLKEQLYYTENLYDKRKAVMK